MDLQDEALGTAIRKAQAQHRAELKVQPRAVASLGVQFSPKRAPQGISRWAVLLQKEHGQPQIQSLNHSLVPRPNPVPHL